VLELSTPIKFVKRVGERVVVELSKRGVETMVCGSAGEGRLPREATNDCFRTEDCVRAQFIDRVHA
jgi:hypothetical protein